MTHRRASIPAVRLPWLRRLDYLPPWLAIVVGLGAGAALGVVFMVEASVVGAMLFVVAVGLAAVLAFSGEPVAVLEQAEEPEVVPRKRVVPAEAWVWVPAGTFLMGSPDDEKERYDSEGPAHEVSVSAFECLRTPVTRSLYSRVMGEDPGWPGGEADDRPVNKVSWFDAIKFCNQLSEEEELAPCYRFESEEQVVWDRAADGYRLPTEAEWEYACRAGSRTRWFFGDDEEEFTDHAWFGGNSDGQPRAAGVKKANAWGLHDMHGNVYEWCWDRFGPYSDESQADPVGPEQGGGRVLRGGAFWDVPSFLRSAYRTGFVPRNRREVVGFRCVRRPRRQR